MQTIKYNGTMITVNDAQAEVLNRRMQRDAKQTKVREVVKSHVADVCGDTVIAGNAVGRVSLMRAALDTVRATAWTSGKLLKLANAANNKACSLAEQVLARSKNQEVTVA